MSNAAIQIPEGYIGVSLRDFHLSRLPWLQAFLDRKIVPSPLSPLGNRPVAWAGWGLKPSGIRAAEHSSRDGVPCLRLEDGFIRSLGLGVSGIPPLSLIVDDIGIYYDATRPSRLEKILNDGVFETDELDRARLAIDFILDHHISKYNHAPDIPDGYFGKTAHPRVLVVDQTANDASITYGLADTGSFESALAAARRENPEANIYIKTHPDVLAGKKRGCLNQSGLSAEADWITGDWNPFSILNAMDRVYVVTSQMGFEALMLGKPVTCFGMPFYAGWGLTDDRVDCTRRTAHRTLLEVFAAAYLLYARYLKPETSGTGTIFDVLEYLARQKKMASRTSGKFFCFGFGYWKRTHIRPFFGNQANLEFVACARQARARGISKGGQIAVWGQRASSEVSALADELGCSIFKVEDGFIRSIGLGADFIRPWSLVIDKKGIYFDPSKESDLEHLLNTAEFQEDLVLRARALRKRIYAEGITKYNTEPDEPLLLKTNDRRVVFVPGQVEDDASILKGAGAIRTNDDLLDEVRRSEPGAFIIYKPHPDVLARNRKGKMNCGRMRVSCDHLETHLSVTSCIEAADEIHTMTSLAGFDALVRGKRVVTYGAPFYAGWGLTEDRVNLPRRSKRLSLDELVAGTLLIYPRYWDWRIGGFVECEHIVERIIWERRTSEGKAMRNRHGFFRRQPKRWAAFLSGVLASVFEK